MRDVTNLQGWAPRNCHTQGLLGVADLVFSEPCIGLGSPFKSISDVTEDESPAARRHCLRLKRRRFNLGHPFPAAYSFRREYKQ
jgi:hypothetical protein